MSDLYGKTTESLESLQNISCGTKLTCGLGNNGGKKNVQKDIELTSVEHNAESELVTPETNEESETTTSPKQRFQNVTKGVMLAKKFLSEDPAKQHLRVQRQKRHLHQFSKIRRETDHHHVQVDEGETEQLTRASAVVTHEGDRRGRRDNAAKVLFKAGVNKLRTKPTFKASALDTFGGRSFQNSDLKDAENEAVFAGAELDFSFFDFSNEAEMRDELPPDLEHGDDESEETFTRAAAFGRGRSKIGPYSRKKKKPRFWLGSLLGGRVKRNISAKFSSDADEEREYFTVWLSFVQIVIMIVVLCIYGFAPIGKDTETVNKDVLLSREGVPALETLSRKVVESFWLGPSLESLILLGAKYAPCMRRDAKVYAAVEKERKLENSTGCCMQNEENGNGCIQREKKYCLSPNVEFKPLSVCAQDRKFCKKASKPPKSWDPSTIISWPKCEEHREFENIPTNKHMTCVITGRPCCVNTQGQCVITTEDNCKFWDGIYHPDATLCSQVDCLSATCGNSFYNNDQPDQIYRLLLSLFLCAGILHLVVVLIFNFTLLRYVEVYAGWFRTGLIFFLTGIGGNLWSAILLPYQAEVGESGAMFGIFACVFVEGIQNWKQFEQPWHYIGKLLGILFVMFLFGLLPYVDNSAHIFGFIYGMFLGFIVLPHVPVNTDEEGIRREKRNYLILRLICLVFVFLLFIVGFVLFYFQQDLNSKAISLFNCPFGEKLCQKFHQGLKLESRDIEF